MKLAGISIDDVFVIILFFSLIQSYQTNLFSIQALLFIPISLILGIGLGVLMGLILLKLFKKFHMIDTIKVLLIFSTSFFSKSLKLFKRYCFNLGISDCDGSWRNDLKQHEVFSTSISS